MSSARLTEIVVGGERAPWERLGLVLESGAAVVGSVRIRVVPFLSPGIQTIGITPADSDSSADAAHVHDGACDHDHGPRPSFVDGAPVHTVPATSAPVPASAVPDRSGGADGREAVLDARVIDHVVLMTPDLERTCDAAAAATGAPLKRIREAGTVRQGFFRLGEVILEVVQSPQVAAGPARWWGLVLTVGDTPDSLVALCDRLGPEVISAPRPAVQPGRFIATVRAEVGLGVPVALISPDPRRTTTV